jgi:formate/nitrite transporter FocA (FNT family)
MAWANRRIRLSQLLRNWTLVYIGNLIGALATVVLMYFTFQYTFKNGAVGLNVL